MYFSQSYLIVLFISKWLTDLGIKAGEQDDNMGEFLSTNKSCLSNTKLLVPVRK